jgi:hypothetical protein
MACPYFQPKDRFDDKTWRKHPRLPLGDPYTGLCQVDPMRDWAPDAATLRDCCNLGNARKKCSRFPEDAVADAVRFSVTGDENGVVRIFFVRERGQEPVEHGTLDYSTQSGEFLGGGSSRLEAQARAYLVSYFRRKSEPEETAKNPHRR